MKFVNGKARVEHGGTHLSRLAVAHDLHRLGFGARPCTNDPCLNLNAWIINFCLVNCPCNLLVLGIGEEHFGQIDVSSCIWIKNKELRFVHRELLVMSSN